jgi:hypothetical protein
VIETVKAGLLRVGLRAPARLIHDLNAATNYLDTGHWMREHGFASTPCVPFSTRRGVFDLILADVQDEAVLYLEFGVYRGGSLRYWSERLTNPNAHLHAFDSFQGLPETWSYDHPRGRFAISAPPSVDDSRVEFFIGWFADILPAYAPPPHERVVVNVDCDLYSSASTVLQAVEPLLGPGSYLYFDEFHDCEHERRAFTAFLERTEMHFRGVGASRDYNHVAFVRDA